MSASKEPRFKVSDVVRVEKYYLGTRFKKGYKENFTTNYLKLLVHIEETQTCTKSKILTQEMKSQENFTRGS